MDSPVQQLVPAALGGGGPPVPGAAPFGARLPLRSREVGTGPVPLLQKISEPIRSQFPGQ